jgi:hypothetical protein
MSFEADIEGAHAKLRAGCGGSQQVKPQVKLDRCHFRLDIYPKTLQVLWTGPSFFLRSASALRLSLTTTAPIMDFISPFSLACATFDITSHTSVTTVAAILEPITAKLAQSKPQRYSGRERIT